MAEFGVSEFILVVAAVAIGITIFGFTEAYLVPNYSFTNAQQQANSISQSVFVSISPPGISTSGEAFLGYIYSPTYSGNFFIVAFCVNPNELPSLSVVTPSSEPFTIELTNGAKATEATLPRVYDTNGQILSSNVIAYSVPSNQPFEILGNSNSNNVLVVWIIYYSSGYYFRITYTYTG